MKEKALSDNAGRGSWGQALADSNKPAKPLKMHRDPLVRAMSKAYKASKRYQFDQLMAERAKWSRRKTIADNKLAEVQADIVRMLQELVQESEKTGGDK